MRSAPFWVTAQSIVVIPYRRFGTTYRFHLQWSRNPTTKTCHTLALCLCKGTYNCCTELLDFPSLSPHSHCINPTGWHYAYWEPINDPTPSPV